MVKNCASCKTKCCKTGPGPYRSLPAKKYLERFGDAGAYNTKCENLKKGKCSVWKTPDFPVECFIYVCQTRTYTKDELKKIESVDSWDSCPRCKTDYHLTKWIKKDKKYKLECPSCEYEWEWATTKNEHC